MNENDTIESWFVDALCRKMNRALRVGWPITRSAKSLYATIDEVGYCGAQVSEADLGKLWVTLRMAVPRLVVHASQGHRKAEALLDDILRNLDPTIEVPWHPRSAFGSNPPAGPGPDSEIRDEFKARLRSLWNEAMRRAQTV
ncbi:hypothetical protein [Streptomyces hokutonensis]|uniref:hypothetical protein n=1 Tax=Streptomyces hokutonensis TaxID=1306990 RepID=UPI0033E3B1C5